MFFSTKNQQRIPSHYVDFYIEFWYLNDGYFGLSLTYVLILLESLESRVFFIEIMMTLVVFPWSELVAKSIGCNDMGPLIRKSFNPTFSFNFLRSWFLTSILWKSDMIF